MPAENNPPEKPRSELDRLVERFEAAWQHGEPPAIEDYLPRDQGRRQTLLVELVHLDLERRLALGEAVLVEQYLAKFPELAKDQTVVADLVACEYRLRERRDPGLTRATFFERFPQYREELARRAADPHPPSRRFPAHLNCPHCNSPVEVITDGPEEEILCPSCGSTFRTDPDHTQAWSKDALPELGKFELIEAVGRGAFGTVYRARDMQLQRIVAIKVPRSGRLVTDEDADRFVREARNTAQLQHVGIVPIYEVGRSDAFPYIVSEFVDGVTLADALTARRFGSREAARLTAAVAAALQHAHDHGVVHRDLKPSNIMLTADGSPRVMDFGLAKRDAGDVTMTIDGQVLGTPAYMSPEQASGQAHHVDGRSDVYSLGGILYELLTGELPFRGNQRMILHQVLHDEPRSPRSLNDRISRDMETICLKAMAKEPDRRYPTAQAMADDLTRHLGGQPILARPVGPLERSWRWSKRNPVIASLAAAIVCILMAGTIISTVLALEAQAQTRAALAEKSRADAKAAEADREREKAILSQKLETAQRQTAQDAKTQATEEARKSREVSRFLATMFEESAPFEMAGLRFETREKSLASANLTARQILERGAERVTTELRDQPIVQAALMDTIGNVYLGLGIIDKAETSLQVALALRQKHLPREHVEVASSLHSIGVLRFGQLRFAEAVSAFSEALSIRRKLLGEDHESVDSTRVALGCVLSLTKPGGASHDVPLSIVLGRESLAWRRSHLGDKHRQTAIAMLGLAGALLNGNEHRAEATSLLLEATPILLNDPTTKPLGVIMTQLQTAKILEKLGNREGVVAATHKALAACRDAADDTHPFMVVVRGIAAENLIYGMQFDEAEKLCRESLERTREPGKAPTAIDAPFVRGLAQVLARRFTTGNDSKDLDEAEKLYRQCISIEHEHSVEPTLELVEVMKSIAKPLQELELPRAEALYRDAVIMTRESVIRQRKGHESEKLDISPFAEAVTGFASVLRDCGRNKEAELLYRDSLALASEHKDSSYTIQFQKELLVLQAKLASPISATGSSDSPMP